MTELSTNRDRRARRPDGAIAAAGAVGVAAVLTLGAWVWTWRREAAVTDRTRDRLARRPLVAADVPSAAEITVANR